MMLPVGWGRKHVQPDLDKEGYNGVNVNELTSDNDLDPLVAMLV
jgi:hypothetical protein